MTVSWPDVASDFVPDGSLRDLYVFGAEVRDWDAVLAHLRGRYEPLAFTFNGRSAPLPTCAAEAFAIGPTAPPRLTFTAGGVDVACHFFTPNEIELDLSPELVDGPERLASVVELLRSLAVVTGKVAVLTLENQPHAIILRADPVTGRVSHRPPTDAPAV
jgi:hypothetical protein